MKKICFYILLLIAAPAAAQTPLEIMSFNIRFNNPGDSLNAWPNRKDKVVSQILYYNVDILGVQEALVGQMNDMLDGLKKYKALGVGRDGGTKGEHSAILYDSSRLQVLDSKTFWLSLTPDVVASKSWDAALTRIVTWAKFKDRKTKKTFYFFNTHFDHVGKEARRESATMLKKKVAEIAGATPAIITGDFNARPADEPIKVLMDETDPMHFTDTKNVSLTPHYGPIGTFNGFGPREKEDQPIDHIYIRGKWKIMKHATISETWNGRFASDHFAVLVQAVL